jgi:hypothetical protein
MTSYPGSRYARHREIRGRTLNVWRENSPGPLDPESVQLLHDRPRCRADCERVERPCPWVGCKWNLYLDVNWAGTIKLNFPDIDPDEMDPRASCVLDIADQGGVALEKVGEAMNLTRERIRQIEKLAVKKFWRAAKVAGLLGALLFSQLASDGLDVGSCYSVPPICIQGQPVCMCDYAMQCFWSCR